VGHSDRSGKECRRAVQGNVGSWDAFMTKTVEVYRQACAGSSDTSGSSPQLDKQMSSVSPLCLSSCN
jgi:hypothetical protein